MTLVWFLNTNSSPRGRNISASSGYVADEILKTHNESKRGGVELVTGQLQDVKVLRKGLFKCARACALSTISTFHFIVGSDTKCDHRPKTKDNHERDTPNDPKMIKNDKSKVYYISFCMGVSRSMLDERFNFMLRLCSFFNFEKI